MRDIAIIFFLLILSVLPVSGQTSNSRLRVSELPPADFGHGNLMSSSLIAQSETRQGSEATPSNSKPEETSAQSPIQITDQENDGIKQEKQSQWEKKQRILKIVNDYELAADEALTTLIMIAGDARLQGSVTGNVLVLGGGVELTQGAQVNGTLQVIGGQVSGSIEGVANLQVSNDWEIVPAAVKLVMHPYIFWKITDKQANLQWTLIKSGIFLLMYLLVLAVLPKPINAISGLLARRPIGSLLFGILMLPVIPLILTLLTVSIVGVPFMLLGLALLAPLAVCGKTAIFLTLGSTLFSGRLKPLGVIFGYILYFMATALPYIDWVTFLLVNTISIGLCLLSGISTMLLEDRRKNISWSERV
jgi:hypothetical protein